MHTRSLFGFFAAIAITASSAVAGVQLNRFYTDGMVLQRGKPVVIRGSADGGANVTVSFAGQSKATTAEADGTWSVTLDAMKADAEGAALTARANASSAKIDNVVVGDVFLFAYQASVDATLSRDEAGRKIAAQHSRTPNLRVVSITTVAAATPQSDLAEAATSGWSAVDSKTAGTMGAAAYHFASQVAKQVDVPVGVIDLNMGAHFPIGWLSRDAIALSEKLTGNGEPDRVAKRMEALAELHARGEPAPPKEAIKGDPLAHPFYPAAGYNAVLHPLRGLAIKAAVVQIGGNYPYTAYARLERNGDQLDRPKLNDAYVETYDIRKVGHRMDPHTTTRIPRQWRAAFGDDDLPIGLIMAPGSGLGTLADHHIEMRELQRQMAEKNPGVGLILPGMDAVPFSVQPADAETTGDRSARWALGTLYGKGPATGPLFDGLEPSYNTVTIVFKPGTAKGLRKAGERIEGFEVAGVEGDYFPASASINGETINLHSDEVRRISRVRYNWRQAPREELVNAAGLPAIPFRTEDARYGWFHVHADDDLPMEYSTPANAWQGGDVTLVNGQVKTHGYDNFTGWLGPVGIRVGPFGPNMAVRAVSNGSPADGKVFVGDVIYSANGKMLGDDAPKVMSAAITHSETREGNGKLTLGLRRGNENIDVVVDLEVLGRYSPTAPYDCPKTERIVAKLEAWLAARGGAGENFLSTDSLFLLGADSPQYQGLVRRSVYSKLGFKGASDGRGNNWYLGYDAILLAEYFLATGDPNVLPALKRMTDNIIANQIEEADAGPMTGRMGGWYGKNKAFRNYPTMPSAGLACMIGLTLAREAGVEIDEEAYQAGLEHFRRKGAPVGHIIYGDAWRDEPSPMVPPVMARGGHSSDNGKLSLGAVLFELAGDRRTSHYLSLISAFSWNTTYHGHGGNFWNNFWTPIGANTHSKAALLNFWDGHRWYRELNRMYDGCLIQTEGSRVGAGPGLALVIPAQRLRILGAPVSPFSTAAPEFLKPALDAYARRDYAKAQELTRALLAAGTIGKKDLPTVEKLAREARRIRQSIESDLARLERLVGEGRFHEAKLDITQLKGVMPEGDARLAAINKALAGKPRANDAELYNQRQKALTSATSDLVTPADAGQRQWTPLVTAMRANAKDKQATKVSQDHANRWRLRVVENRSQAPEGWMKPGFDDSSWNETVLPISWRLNHTALLRTTFNVDEADAVDALRFRGWVFRQQDIEIYLNGKLIGRVNNIEKKTGNIEAEFKDWAAKQLVDGENTLAVTTRQNWRWGMLFMRVYNDGFDFRLEAGMAE